MHFLAAAASALLVAVSAAPAELSPLGTPATVIADGKKVHEGALPDWNFKYHASGYLAKGGCPANGRISTCYVYTLSGDPTKNLDKSPFGSVIQDVILNGPSHPADGSVRKYTFRMQVDPSLTSTSSDSCPLVEIASQEEDGTPSSAVYLDVRDNQAGIFAFTDTSTPSVSIPLNQFTGKSTYQTWIVKSGPNGWADITIIDEATGKNLLKYNATGQNSRETYHMRVGTDRSIVDIKPMKVYWGDWLGQFV
ncbi:hypothetical protein FRC08_009013 [Ceratobasidium sp. 394]|nr:hypothetical protein FRC08_009013 [Ceratobasidium sp. 394]KAG9102320.1 hypothetical protein FS749_007203 [Ceratobasidium sp. UAMH 11750]